jgi:hypothetical protein
MTRTTSSWSGRLAVVLFLALTVAACSRGPNPPSPTEELIPSTVGVIVSAAVAPPISLRDGRKFAPPPGSTVERIKNWPAWDTYEAEGIFPDLLLLGGQRPDGSWWYQLAGSDGPNDEGCWRIGGGSFEEGDRIRLSSGLVLPKAPGFEIRADGHEDSQWFPGHQDDSICVDEQGRAVYFDAFIGA